MARLEIPMNNLNEEQRAYLDGLVKGPRGASVAVGAPHGPPHGIFGAWVLNPTFGDHTQRFGAYIRHGTSLPLRLSELAILVCARYWMAQYEYWAHAPIALKAGVPATIVAALRTGVTPCIEDEHDRAVFDVARQLLEEKQIFTETYARAVRLLGTATLIELVGIIGYYSLVGMTVRAFEIEVPAEHDHPME